MTRPGHSAVKGWGLEPGPRPGPRLCAERAAGICGQRLGHRVGAASAGGESPRGSPRELASPPWDCPTSFPFGDLTGPVQRLRVVFSFSNDSRNQRTKLSSPCSKDGSLFFFLSLRIGKQASRLWAAPRGVTGRCGGRGPLQLQLCAVFVSLVLELSLQVSFPET